MPPGMTLEKIFSGEQLRVMDELLENIKAQARNNANTAIEQARMESERRINQESKVGILQEQVSTIQHDIDNIQKTLAHLSESINELKSKINNLL